MEANNVERCFIPLLTCSVVHSTGYFSLSPQPVPLDQYYLETLGQRGLTPAAEKKEKQKENKKNSEFPFCYSKSEQTVFRRMLSSCLIKMSF